jgi:proton-coupled amino acid transporter
MTTVFVGYAAFGEFCYFVYGNKITTPLITENLPPGNAFASVIKVLFCINLVFTYPLVLYPANIIIEGYLFGHMPKSKKRQWSKNVYRGLMVAFTIVVAVLLGESLDKFLALLGAVGCTPIAFTLPAFFHYKLVAKTKKEKNIDIALIVISLLIMIFCTGFCIATWNK